MASTRSAAASVDVGMCVRSSRGQVRNGGSQMPRSLALAAENFCRRTSTPALCESRTSFSRRWAIESSPLAGRERLGGARHVRLGRRRRVLGLLAGPASRRRACLGPSRSTSACCSLFLPHVVGDPTDSGCGGHPGERAATAHHESHDHLLQGGGSASSASVARSGAVRHHPIRVSRPPRPAGRCVALDLRREPTRCRRRRRRPRRSSAASGHAVGRQEHRGEQHRGQRQPASRPSSRRCPSPHRRSSADREGGTARCRRPRR